MQDTGERQVAKTVDGIRKDHRARYEWAAKRLSGTVIDIGCGVGYGSRVLADSGCQVYAFDKSPAAIDFAGKNYGTAGITFEVADVSTLQTLPDIDGAVCFELIEHLEDPRPMLKALRKSAKTLLVSVPNEETIPWRYGTYDYHHRHYTRREIEILLAECGWKVDEWFGQRTTTSEVSDATDVMTIIASCVTAPDGYAPVLPNATVVTFPHSVAIIGLGPSKHEYASAVCGASERRRIFDQTWCINGSAAAFDHDLMLHMDDVRVQMVRAKARPGSNIAAMVEFMRNHDKPIMTSRAHPDFPTMFEVPLAAMLQDLTYDYFNNTAAWGMAYAIHLGVKRIGLFGCDYTYPNRHDAEKGRACLEFWMGYGSARGVRFVLPQSTTLMDAIEPRHERLYGFDTRRVLINKDDYGTISLEYEEVEVPTAEEIEWKYNHSRHPNVLAEEDEA